MKGTETLITAATCPLTNRSLYEPRTAAGARDAEVPLKARFLSLNHSSLGQRASPQTRCGTSQIVSQGCLSIAAKRNESQVSGMILINEPHLLFTKSRCHRRSVRGLTRNDDHRVQGSNPPSAAMNNRSRRRSRGLPTWRLRNHQLVAEDRKLDVAVQIVGRVGKQQDETAHQEMHESEEHGRKPPRRRRPDGTNALVEGR